MKCPGVGAGIAEVRPVETVTSSRVPHHRAKIGGGWAEEKIWVSSLMIAFIHMVELDKNSGAGGQAQQEDCHDQFGSVAKAQEGFESCC